MGNPRFGGAVTPLTNRLNIWHGWLRQRYDTTCQNGKNRPRRADLAKGWNAKVKCGYFLFFSRFLARLWKPHFLHWSTPFLRQITCFGGIDFLGVSLLALEFSPHKPHKPQFFGPYIDLENVAQTRFTLGMLQSNLPLIIIVAPESRIVYMQIGVKVSKFLVVAGLLRTGHMTAHAQWPFSSV